MYDAIRIRHMIDELRQIERLMQSEDARDQDEAYNWFKRSFGDGERLAMLEDIAAHHAEADMRDVAHEALDYYDRSPGGARRRKRLAYLEQAPDIIDQLQRIINELKEIVFLTTNESASLRQRGNALFQTKFADSRQHQLILQVVNDEDYPPHVRDKAFEALSLYNRAPLIRNRKAEIESEARQGYDPLDVDVLLEPESSGVSIWWFVLGLLVLVTIGLLFGLVTGIIPPLDLSTTPMS